MVGLSSFLPGYSDRESPSRFRPNSSRFDPRKDGENRQKPTISCDNGIVGFVLKTGTITGPHALPYALHTNATEQAGASHLHRS